MAAVAHWEDQTALRFVERRDQADYIRVVYGVGCSPNVGRIGGEQQLSLGPNCETCAVIWPESGSTEATRACRATAASC